MVVSEAIKDDTKFREELTNIDRTQSWWREIACLQHHWSSIYTYMLKKFQLVGRVLVNLSNNVTFQSIFISLLWSINSTLNWIFFYVILLFTVLFSKFLEMREWEGQMVHSFLFCKYNAHCWILRKWIGKVLSFSWSLLVALMPDLKSCISRFEHFKEVLHCRQPEYTIPGGRVECCSCRQGWIFQQT